MNCKVDGEGKKGKVEEFDLGVKNEYQNIKSLQPSVA
jgi:hypothetical protein